MELSVTHSVALWGFLGALVFGVIASRSHFCTMGAISDWVNMGDKTRLRAWFLAIGVAMLGTQLLTLVTPINLVQSIYLAPNLGWLGHLLGGFAFGIGMTLAGGCGQRTLVRAGAGSLKSLVVLLVLAVSAAMTLYGLFALARIEIVAPTAIELDVYGVATQSMSDLLAAVTSFDPTVIHWITTCAISAGFLIFALANTGFREHRGQLLAGVAVGLLIVAGWYITSVVGADDLEPTKLASYTFVAPIADTLQYLMTFTGSTIDFGIAAVFGVLLGSFLDAIVAGKFRIETFVARNDMLAHLVGGVCMGFGGVLALGCTIGQGITGMSTLAAGSALTLSAIIFGSVLTLKTQYHMLDASGFWHALRLALAELRLVSAPRKTRSV